MGDDLARIVVIGFSAAVLIVVVAFVLVAVKTDRPRRASSLLKPGASSDPVRWSSASLARGVGHLYGPIGARRQTRSVADNVARAAQRIDDVDPYAAPRRIGEALSHVGLVPAPASPTDADDAGNTDRDTTVDGTR